MKLKLNEDGELFVKKKDSGGFEVVVVEPDGKEHEVDIIQHVKKSRSDVKKLTEKLSGNESLLREVNSKLEAFEGDDGVVIDAELAKTAVKQLKELKGKAVDADSLVAKEKENWKRELDEAITPLQAQISSLRQEKKKAMLLGAAPLQKTLHYALGEKHLMAEFGHLIDDEGKVFDWKGKPLMSPSNPSEPATINEAAEIWISTHDMGKEAILKDGFKGGTGEPKDKKHIDPSTPSDGYAFFVENSQK
jgi:hypothetical protein